MALYRFHSEAESVLMKTEKMFEIKCRYETCPRCSSGKHVRVIYTPLYPTFIQQNWGMPGYTYFSYFCSKT